eukprot:RCo001287
MGYGVGKNLPMAVEWFRKAAGQGHAEARDALRATPTLPFAGRLTGNAEEIPGTVPIRGLNDAPDLSLPECIAYAEALDPVFRQMELVGGVVAATDFAQNILLTDTTDAVLRSADDIAAI